MPRLVVVVHGIPAPQGSKRHVGNGVLVESSAKVAPWRALVVAAVVDVLTVARHPVPATLWRDVGRDAPIELSAVFTLARPASHYRTGKHSGDLRAAAPEQPVGRPDLDKLLRSTLDGLTDAGALADDARVVDVHAVKVYPGGHLDALDTPGAVLTLRAG